MTDTSWRPTGWLLGFLEHAVGVRGGATRFSWIVPMWGDVRQCSCRMWIAGGGAFAVSVHGFRGRRAVPSSMLISLGSVWIARCLVRPPDLGGDPRSLEERPAGIDETL